MAHSAKRKAAKVYARGKRPFDKLIGGNKREMIAASRILSAPKGPRTLTHREIEQAVQQVFEARRRADA